MSKALVRIKKREFGSYNDWLSEIERHSKRYEMLMHNLTTIGGKGFSDMPSGNFNSDKALQDTIRIQHMSDIESVVNEYKRKIREIDYFLDCCDEEVSYAVKEIYLKGRSYESVAMKVNRSDAGLSYIIEEEIKKHYL